MAAWRKFVLSECFLGVAIISQSTLMQVALILEYQTGCFLGLIWGVELGQGVWETEVPSKVHGRSPGEGVGPSPQKLEYNVRLIPLKKHLTTRFCYVLLCIVNATLDGQGRARREAARRRNSECKINLSDRNSCLGNGTRPTAQR